MQNLTHFPDDECMQCVAWYALWGRLYIVDLLVFLFFLVQCRHWAKSACCLLFHDSLRRFKYVRTSCGWVCAMQQHASRTNFRSQEWQRIQLCCFGLVPLYRIALPLTWHLCCDVGNTKVMTICLSRKSGTDSHVRKHTCRYPFKDLVKIHCIARFQPTAVGSRRARVHEHHMSSEKHSQKFHETQKMSLGTESHVLTANVVRELSQNCYILALKDHSVSFGRPTTSCSFFGVCTRSNSYNVLHIASEKTTERGTFTTS